MQHNGSKLHLNLYKNINDWYLWISFSFLIIIHLILSSLILSFKRAKIIVLGPKLSYTDFFLSKSKKFTKNFKTKKLALQKNCFSSVKLWFFKNSDRFNFFRGTIIVRLEHCVNIHLKNQFSFTLLIALYSVIIVTIQITSDQ